MNWCRFKYVGMEDFLFLIKAKNPSSQQAELEEQESALHKARQHYVIEEP